MVRMGSWTKPRRMGKGRLNKGWTITTNSDGSTTVARKPKRLERGADLQELVIDARTDLSPAQDHHLLRRQRQQRTRKAPKLV